MNRIFCLVIGYFFGCILTAEIVAKANHKDIREIDPDAPHRGNPGMANVMLNMGFSKGVIVFIGDALKTIAATLISYQLFKDTLGVLALFYAGFGCLLGHNYPFWRRFSGGKGVLVTIIWFVIIMPKHCWLALIIAAIFVFISGYLNLAAVIFPIIATPIAFMILGIEGGILVGLSAIIMVMRNWHDIVCTFKGERSRFFGPFKNSDKIKKKEE